MREDAHLIAAKDRNGRISDYFKCSRCDAEFRRNPTNPRQIALLFAAHIRLSHADLKVTRKQADQAGLRIAEKDTKTW
jgi:uncharacterized C2H2 Zn-finger protein